MPFCPKCRTEYREGFNICADCQVALVDKLPKYEENMEYELVPTEINSTSLKYITVFVSDESEEADMVKRVLNENKIPYITRGEEETKFKYIDFLVREDRLDAAKELLKDIIEQESAGVDTVFPATQKTEADFKIPPSITDLTKSRKESTGRYLLILGTVFVFSILISVRAKSIAYGVVGILVVVFILVAKFIYSRDKRL